MMETFDGRCTLVIAQMTAALHDSHLEFICIRTRHQHIDVIIGLDDNRISLKRKLHSLICHSTDISHYHEFTAIHLYRTTHCLSCIMRHYKITDLESSDLIPCPFLQDLAARTYGRSSESMTRQSTMDITGRKDRFCQTLAE